MTMMGVMRHLGADVQLHPNGRLDIVPSSDDGWEAPEHLVRQMRASVLVMGPVLAKTGRVRISMPGGCAIGPRPIDLHLRGLRQMGADIVEERGFVEARASRLEGAEIQLDFPSVGATETISVNAVWVTSADQPEELIYGIAKAMWNENTRKLLDTGHAKGKVIRAENATTGIGIPLHPGAERYYKEAGLLK